MKIIERGVPLAQASKAIILLHGRGGTAEVILQLADKGWKEHFYIVAPQAPNNIWYPNSFLSEESRNEPYLSESVQNIKDLIDQMATRIPKDQIVIMGFSQGACLSLEISSRFAEKYGGIAAFTGGLIGRNIDENKYQGNFEGTKVLISNGDHDPFIPLIRSEQSKELMEKLGANVTLKVYPGRNHIITENEIEWVEKNILFSI